MKRHHIIIEHEGAKTYSVAVSCKGDGCPLRASTAESRAKIAFVKSR